MSAWRSSLTSGQAILVIGYSWQDATLPTAGAVGQGWHVAWRRFLLVLIGISIAFLGAFLPPRSTQKTTIRRTYARTLEANASILFRVISLNVGKEKAMQRLPNSVIQNITATRYVASVPQKTKKKKCVLRQYLQGPAAWKRPRSQYDQV